MNEELNKYRELINLLISKYENEGEEVPKPVPTYENNVYPKCVNVTQKTDEFISIRAYDNIEYNEKDRNFVNEDETTYTISFIDGFLVCKCESYIGWSKCDYETGAECGDGKSTVYNLMSFVGYDYNSDNLPHNIDNIVKKSEQGKLKNIIESLNGMIGRENERIISEIEAKSNHTAK